MIGAGGGPTGTGGVEAGRLLHTYSAQDGHPKIYLAPNASDAEGGTLPHGGEHRDGAPTGC